MISDYLAAILSAAIAMWIGHAIGEYDGCREARLEQAQLRAKIELILDAYKRVDTTITGIYDTKQTPLCDLSVCGQTAVGGE